MLINILSFNSFLVRIKQEFIDGYSDVIVPQAVNNGGYNELFFSKPADEHFKLSEYRQVDPLKFLFYFPRERLYPSDSIRKKRIIAGVKACDLKALLLLDKAMLGEDFIDPEYKKWRENTLIISADCLSIKSTCHCTVMNGVPFCESGFDINLSEVGEDYYITTGSQKGNEFLELLKKNLPVREAGKDTDRQVETLRKTIIRLLNKQNEEYVRKGEYSKMRFSPMDNWKEESKECIGCGGCTNICPTCYCLILNDESKERNFIKVRTYDSCQLHGYAKVAGGGSPRPKMYERFRNRYLCKFDYMKHNFNEYGCTGCGRCTDVCAAKIDFRKVVSVVLNSGSNLQTPATEVRK